MAGLFAPNGAYNTNNMGGLVQTVSTLTGTNSATLTSVDYNRKLIFAHATFVASATVGNRKLELQLINGGSVEVGDWHVTPSMVASTTYHVEFLSGTYREATFDANNVNQTPFPMGLIIPAGYTLKFADSANIDATGDAITVYVQTVA